MKRTMTGRSGYWISLLTITLTAILSGWGTPARGAVPGTIHLENGRTIDFEEVLSLSYLPEDAEEGARTSAWPLTYSHSSPARVVPISWIRAIRVEGFKVQGEAHSLIDVSATIETVTGVEIPTQYRALERIRVRVRNSRGGAEERTVYFGSHGTINIRQISFDQED